MLGELCYSHEYALFRGPNVNQSDFSQVDKLSVMHAFRRIVERGSFARAAEDLGVSPALLSREVKLLEESLGTTLLTRTTRSMSLTDAE